jgi:hypothetical protein
MHTPTAVFLHMKNPFSAWNVNAKIGINMIKPKHPETNRCFMT